MEEHERARREQSIQEKYHAKASVLWIIISALTIMCMVLSTWLVRGVISGRGDLFLLPAVSFFMLYFVFTVFTIYTFLSTSVTKDTKLNGKLLWWHGAGWCLAMACMAIGGLIVLFTKSLLF